MRLALTIALNVLIVILIGLFIFVGIMVFRAYSEENASISEFIDPAYLISLVDLNLEEEWVLYDSLTYTFEHPSSWKPLRKQAQTGTLEIIDLRIPVVFSLPRSGSTTTIGYYRETVEKMRPPAIVEESDITFGGRQGYKWIYKTENKNVMYMYVIPLGTELTASRQALTFALMVEAVRADKDLEAILDRLVQSVVFKEL